jgi:uracil-DNA glycosylase family protein
MTETFSITTLAALREAESACQRCELYLNATQAVPGEGPQRARLMMVGEQPGNQEDLVGKPFIGPAGHILDRAIREAGIDRREVFVTNAVKHFKFEGRGKRRLHKRPNSHEIDRCRWWNDIERAIVRPSLVVALGATAARSLTGRTATIANSRNKLLRTRDGYRLMVTIHPSYLLRITDQESKDREYAQFVADLVRCAQVLDEAA